MHWPTNERLHQLRHPPRRRPGRLGQAHHLHAGLGARLIPVAVSDALAPSNGTTML